MILAEPADRSGGSIAAALTCGRMRGNPTVNAAATIC